MGGVRARAAIGLVAFALCLGTTPAFAADPAPAGPVASVPTVEPSVAPVAPPTAAAEPSPAPAPTDPAPSSAVAIEPSPTASVTLPSGEKLVTVGCVTDNAQVISVEVPADQAQAAIRTLPLENDCDVADVDRPVHMAVSNDPLRSWALNTVSFEEAWKLTNGSGGGSSVLVAVVDTGVVPGHADLTGQVTSGANYVVFDAPTAMTADGNGHGTHVTGIIAALANNGIGVTGAAPGVSILPVKVLDDTGSGSTLSVAGGIAYAVQSGAKIISLSLGGTQANKSLQDAVAGAISAGVVVVAAAGNDGLNEAFYPAQYPGVISVGATNSSNVRASWSNFGGTLSVVAPGVGIVSTWKDGGYLSLDGTSMATPYVSAEAALLLKANPGWTPAQVKSRIEQTATDLGTVGRDDNYGWGLINPVKALTATVASLSPVRGSVDGGASVTISGSNFTQVSAVRFGGVDAASHTVSSSSSITAVAPAHAAGSVDVTVTTPLGTATQLNAFTFESPILSVTSALPGSGSTSGGTSVTISGSLFTGATAVTFGGANAASFSVLSDSTITAVTPAHALGTVDIAVTVAGTSATLPGSFTFAAPVVSGGSSGGGGSAGGASSPTVADSGGGGGGGASAEVLEVRPAFGPITGGTKVLILGYGFWGANAVTIGGVPASGFRYIDAATIEAVTPPGVTGWQQVVVTLAVGRATAAFKYEGAIAVPASAPTPSVPPAGLSPTPTVDAAVVVAPTGVTAKVRGGVATVTWRHVETTARHREVVTVYAGGKAMKRVAVPSGASKVVVRGLKKGVAYSFKVTMTAGGKRLTSVASRRVRLLA
jgi:subtilisin family serine protease